MPARDAVREGSSLRISAQGQDGETFTRDADLVLVAVGVRPDTSLAVAAGARTGLKGAIEVDEHMRTSLPDVYAAGDRVVTHHRLLGVTWLPLGTTAHKPGRVAGENALGGNRRFAGSPGSQAVKVFDLVAARTGPREHEVLVSGKDWIPATTASSPDDHKAYYPGATPIAIRVTGDIGSGLLLGAQLVGRRGRGDLQARRHRPDRRASLGPGASPAATG
ncbi:FAD-dependent oxidoreductase [Streptomyces mirabilis]|uniref:FAD-dependent oxidoreductase n=1 Tax=Streptomyces mirabilis TaxID=68239 RepID=UPI00332DBE9E